MWSTVWSIVHLVYVVYQLSSFFLLCHPSYLCMLQSVLSVEARTKTCPGRERQTGKYWEGCGATDELGNHLQSYTDGDQRRSHEFCENFLQVHNISVTQRTQDPQAKDMASTHSIIKFYSQITYLLGSKAPNPD